MFGRLKKLLAGPAETKPSVIEEPGRSIALQGHTVDYKLVRRRGRRGISLKVDGTGLTVAASLTAPLPAIENVITDNTRWVLKKLGEWAHRKIVPQTWQTGMTIPYLGGTLTLMLDVDTNLRRTRVEPLLTHLFVHVKSGDEATVQKAVTDWYKKEALPYLAQRAFFYSKLHGLAPPRVFLTHANGRWGSCNSRREVRLAWRLMKARPALIDYVVCHELAHLRHMNHSAAFWQEVERMCPDYEALKKELDANDHRFRAF